MIAAIRPQADLLRKHAGLLNETTPVADALLFLPFRRWVDTADCQPLRVASDLCEANIAFEVVCEDDLLKTLAVKRRPVLLVESRSVLLPPESVAIDQFQHDGGKVVWTGEDQWFEQFQNPAGKPSVKVEGLSTVRAVICDQPAKRIVHLLNLNVQRLSSFEDKVTPAADVRLQVRVPFAPKSVKAISADAEATQGSVPFTSAQEDGDHSLAVTIPHLEISTILLIE